MQFSDFTVDIESGVATVAINRPKKSNSFNLTTIDQLFGLFTELGMNKNVKVIIFHGTGKHFCAGLDVKSVLSSVKDIPEKKLYDAVSGMQAKVTRLMEIKVPIIAVTHGAALGLALDLLGCTSVRIAAKNTIFSIPEVKFGFPADIGALQRCGKLFNNQSEFSRLVLTGENFSSKRAWELGFVSEIVDDKEAGMQLARKWADAIAKYPRDAVLTTQDCLNLQREEPSVSKGLKQVAEANSHILKHLPPLPSKL